MRFTCPLRLVGMIPLCALVLGCQASQRVSNIGWSAPGAEGPIAQAQLGSPEQVKGIEGVKNCYFDGPVCVASQPTPAALRGFANDGVTVVINLRTQKEMDELGFDQAALCEELGMEYVHIPLGGSERVYPPEAVDRFAALMERHDGKALIHCASGGRVTHLYVAYLIKHRGYELNDAYEVGLGLGYQPWPLEMLLDRKVRYVYAD